MKLIILSTLFCSIFLGTRAFAQAPGFGAEEVEVQAVSSEQEILKKKTSEMKETLIAPLSQRASLKETYSGVEFQSTLELRTRRRVGVGLQTMGPVGLLGMMIELNFQPQNSMLLGYGGGPGYNAFNFQWRHLFLGEKFSPYTGLGYARWNSASSSESFKETTPSVLGSRILTDDEKAEGRFGLDLITPNIGFMYQTLQGPYTGMAYFGEIGFLVRVSKLTPHPLGSLGAIYYF